MNSIQVFFKKEIIKQFLLSNPKPDKYHANLLFSMTYAKYLRIFKVAKNLKEKLYGLLKIKSSRNHEILHHALERPSSKSVLPVE